MGHAGVECVLLPVSLPSPSFSFPDLYNGRNNACLTGFVICEKPLIKCPAHRGPYFNGTVISLSQLPHYRFSFIW